MQQYLAWQVQATSHGVRSLHHFSGTTTAQQPNHHDDLTFLL
jgi:hypothetical protein